MNNTELQTTIDLLRRTFPDGIPDKTRVSVFALLNQEGEMSIRSIAHVAAKLTGRPHVDFLSEIDQSTLVDIENDELTKRIRDQLNGHGYQTWLREE